MGIEDRFAYATFRPGQRELAQRVQAACLGGEIIIAEAMSGFGKTAAVLAGVLAAAEESGCKVVYACRTKRQINRVVEEVSRLQLKHRFKAASLSSKFDYCLLRRGRRVPRESFGWYCTFNTSNNICSYFLNVPLAGGFVGLVRESLLRAPSHSELMSSSEALHVCPYEVARLAIAQATVAVVPYHYAFDRRTTSVLFDRNSIERSHTILVVDEAHNLREFYRGMSSAVITFEQVREAIREAEAMLMDEAAESLESLLSTLEQVAAEHQGWMLDRNTVLDRFRSDHGTAWLQNLAFELNASSGAAWGSVVYDRRLPSLILRVGEFVAMLTSSDRAELVKWEGSFGLVDPDPVRDSYEYFRGFRSAVLVSATVSPSNVFTRSIGLRPDLVAVYHVAAEPAVKVKTAIDTGTSTRYKQRTPQMYEKISERVAAVVKSTSSGVGVFAPSYTVLGPIYKRVSESIGGRNMVAEAPGLSNTQSTELFDSFRSADDSVLFAVQGGRFSEGEDFEGGAMGSIVVIGMAVPPPSPMMYAEYECLKRTGEHDSHLMLSRLPALRKAFQAAGRHIRNPGKRGLVFLLDERFGSPTTIGLMPSWLSRDLVKSDLTPDVIESISRGFWSAQS
ncbi:MAG: ATP-dependent DNA helicase [Nitrososphaerota archaeon]|nr:ATP-dependent DNA helicase [Nitrososphaerota archaeon]MDG6952879.1 ATP-dependent DNA helicase [Nitrososphaerota archaeon]MDG6958498.1 ATP-dependent DNA helicase [Nitrososphaerota archaeon]MDG6960165.1 ATP-dependent DNA helicase [Nitrososphaerota archaeon]MDG6965487.1 ATP-dependent DNA helicase [Nitrososphaerota archaeon]